MQIREVFQNCRYLAAAVTMAVLASCSSKVNNVQIIAGGRPSAAENVCLSRAKGISALPEPSIAFVDSFTSDLKERWTAPLNYGNIVTFKTAKWNGKDAMLWINDKPEEADYDTETAIGTKPFSVEGFFQLDLEYNAFSSVGKVLRNSIIHYGNYDFKVCWYRANETAPFAEDYFDCETSPEKYVFNRHTFIIPQGAVSATLHFGFGKPNFQKGQAFAIADLKLNGYGNSGRVQTASSFETAPMRLSGNNFSFDGSVPAGTSVAFCFAYAKDDNGAPGAWSEWSAPISKAGNINPMQDAAWVKCKVAFTSDGSAAASIRSLTIGSTVEKDWETLLWPASIDLVNSLDSFPNAPLKARIIHKAELNWKTSSVKWDDKPVNLQKNHNGSWTYLTIGKSSEFAAGVHELAVHLETVDGGVLDRSLIYYIGDLPKDTPRVSLRKDGMMIVDGKPFFPIGLYVLKKFDGNNNNFDTMFKQLRSAGFNFGREVGCFPNEEKAREFTEAAERNDFKLFLTAGFKYANNQDLKSIAEGVAAMKDCKSILMWYIGDDTSAHNTPEALKRKNDTVKTVDPTRITVQADGVGSMEDSNYQPFVNCTDVFHPEFYPVYVRDGEYGHAECVQRIIGETDACMRDIRMKANAPKGVHALVQNFASRNTEKGGWTWPTAKEVRAMSYATVIRGSTGMLWYMYGPLGGYHGAATVPERWEAQCKLAGEFDALYDVLTAEPVQQPAEPIIVKGPALDRKKRQPVYALLKKSGTRTVLMTVNASVDDVTAQFTLPGFKSAKELFADGKSLSISGNSTLEVPYSRHDVRIFELE